MSTRLLSKVRYPARITAIIALVLFISFFASTSFALTVQGNWTWRADDGDEAGATALAGQNSTISLSDYNNLRLRIEVYEFLSGVTENATVVLQYRAGSGAWVNITADTINHFVISDSNYITDGTATTQDLLADNSTTAVAGARSGSRTRSCRVTIGADEIGLSINPPPAAHHHPLTPNAVTL